MATDATAKYAPDVATPDVKSNNRRSHNSPQSTDIKDDDTFEVSNKTELIRTPVTLLIKVPESNKECKTTRNLLQDLIVQIQQSN